MKKTFLLFFVILLILTACNPNKSNYPGAYNDSYCERVEEARVALSNSNIKDKAGFNKATELVAWTIDKGVDYRFEVFYEDVTTHTTYSLLQIKDRAEFMNNKEYRALLNADLTLAIIDKLEELGIAENSGNIVGMRLSWDKKHKAYYTIVDENGDGTWDLAAKDGWYYPSVGMPFRGDSFTPTSFTEISLDEHASFRTISKEIDKLIIK